MREGAIGLGVEETSRREPRFVGQYFIKMMLSYCLVIFVGLGMVSMFTSSWVVRTLTEKEFRVDAELVQQVCSYSDGKYKTIQNIFAQLYMPKSYYDNYSITDYLNPRRLALLDRRNKREVISGYLQDTCAANDFISDIFIVDYGDRDIFFFSSIAGRDTSLDFNFYDTGIPGGEVDNHIRIIPNHIPEYINASSVNNYAVISYCIYLFDVNAVRFNQPLGYIVVNVWANHFKEAYRNAQSLNGTLFVVDRNGMTLYDSSGAATGQPFEGSPYGIGDIENASSNGAYMVTTQTSELTGYRFMNIVDRGVIRREVGAMRNSLYGVLVVCVLLALVISLVSAALFSRRIKRLVFRMQALERGEFRTYAQPRSNDEIGYLEESFTRMTSRLEKHIQTAYVYRLKSKTAELKALQAQINPHFLFNTLESIRINALMNKDGQTAKMIHLLGNLFRWNIKTPGLFVELCREMEYADAFIELELIRYADAFEVTTDIPQKLLQLGVPKFILQPLVENAIKHGQIGVNPGGLITICARVDDGGSLKIAVADNGRGMDAQTLNRIAAGLDDPGAEPEDSYSIGLSNVHQRLRILFGEPYGLSIESEPGVSTVVTIAMPAMRKEEMESHVQSNHRG